MILTPSRLTLPRWTLCWMNIPREQKSNEHSYRTLRRRRPILASWWKWLREHLVSAPTESVLGKTKRTFAVFLTATTILTSTASPSTTRILQHITLGHFSPLHGSVASTLIAARGMPPR